MVNDFTEILFQFIVKKLVGVVYAESDGFFCLYWPFKFEVNQSRSSLDYKNFFGYT